MPEHMQQSLIQHVIQRTRTLHTRVPTLPTLTSLASRALQPWSPNSFLGTIIVQRNQAQ